MTSDSVEKPAMGVDLLLILLFQAEDHLDWDEVVWATEMTRSARIR